MKRGFAVKLSRTRHVFWTYFISYIIVIILPVLGIGAFVYTLASNMVEEEVSRAALHSSRQKSASIDQFVLEIQSIAVRIGLDGRIISYANNPDQLFLQNDIRDTLKSITGSNDSIQSIEMYFLNSNQIVSSDGFTRSYSGLDRDNWIRKAEGQGGISFWLGTRQASGSEMTNVVTLVLKMPVGMKEQIGLLAVHVYEMKLQDILKKQEGNQNTNTYLIDGNGSLITSYSQTGADSGAWSDWLQDIGKNTGNGSFIQKNGSGQTLVTYVTPLKNGWQVVTETSMQYLYQRLNHIRGFTFAACGLLILAGIFISYWMSRKMYHPIERLLAKTSDFEKALNLAHETEGPARNEFHIISRTLERAFKSNKDWEKHYRANYLAMRERFVMGLLQNKFGSVREIAEKMEYLQLELPENGFAVMLLEINDYMRMAEAYSVTDRNLLKYAIANITEELASGSFRCVMAEVDEHQFALLLNVELEDQADDPRRFKDPFARLAEQIRHQILSLLRLSVTVSIGSVYSGITQAYLSLREAQEVMRVKVITGPSRVLFHEELNRDQTSEYYFPAQTVNRIMNHLKAVQPEQVSELLEKMRDELKQKPNTGPETIYRLYSRLLDEVSLYMQEAGIQPREVFANHGSLYRELAQKETLDAIHEWFADRMGTIIRYAAAQPKTNKYIDQVMEYIHGSYHLDLSLERIADHVKLNHAYLSRMFKQETGKTVVEYLIQIRLEASKSLLRSTDRTIQEIADEVGYTNVNSFIRFFKRYEGITPGEYRKMASMQEEVEA